MKLIITTEKAKIRENIDCIFGYGATKEIISDKNLEVYVYNIKEYYPVLLKREIAKIKKTLSDDDKIIFDKNVPEYIKNEFSDYTYSENSFLACFPNIIRKLSFTLSKENLEVSIISLKSDKAIFQIIDSLKDYVKTISIITHDEAFFEETSEYAWSKYGLVVNLKDFSDAGHKDVSVILNKERDINQDFSRISKYTIDISGEYSVWHTNCLIDFSSFNEKKLSKYMVEMYNFVEKEQKITNFRWKFYKKS